MSKFILLGAIQGLAEFLPISSSGHLVIARHFLGLTEDALPLIVLLHVGTLLAIFTYFRRDITAAFKDPRLLKNIALATVATGLIALTFKKNFEALFGAPRAVSIFLLVNGCILMLTPFFKERKNETGRRDSILFGLAQGVAVIPGISRSGLTITALLACGLARKEAFCFSFLASIPAVAGAFLLECKAAAAHPSFGLTNLLAGLAASYVFGLISLAWLSRIVIAKKFHLFGWYCLAAGTAFLFLLK